MRPTRLALSIGLLLALCQPASAQRLAPNYSGGPDGGYPMSNGVLFAKYIPAYSAPLPIAASVWVTYSTVAVRLGRVLWHQLCLHGFWFSARRCSCRSLGCNR